MPSAYQQQRSKQEVVPSHKTVHRGMGAIPHVEGVAFRVWAPNASSCSVVGDFNDFSSAANPMQHERDGFWYADIGNARGGDEYRYFIRNGEAECTRIDPYARQVTNSVGNAIVHDPVFNWGDDNFVMPPWNELVIYEMLTGMYNDEPGGAPGTFANAEERLTHVKGLGINAIERVPAAEFAGDFSWGYNPAHVFAIESAYGGPRGFKQFIKQAHRRGKLTVAYSGGGKNRFVRYACLRGNMDIGEPKCIAFGGVPGDTAVSREIFRVLQPAALEASVLAKEQFSKQAEAVHSALQRDLQTAQCEATRAQKQFDATDPENRLVADELERRWNPATSLPIPCR